MDRPLVTRLEIPIDPAEALSPQPTCPTLAGALLLPLAPRGWSLRVAPRAAGARDQHQAQGARHKPRLHVAPCPTAHAHSPIPPGGGQRGGEGRPVTILFNALRCDERPAVGSCGGRGTAS